MTPARLAQLKVRPQAAASPAVWLDQLAADAGSGHVRRLVDLRKQLEAQVRAIGVAGQLAACRQLGDAVEALDFALVQPRGWIARATGKGKEATATFVAQHERMLRAGEDFADEVRALQKAQPGQAAVERTLLEFEVELRQVEKIMDQGARWLQDMRNQLKMRQAEAGDAAARRQVTEDTARCELLVARLKQLRTASSVTQQLMERCKGAGGGRASLLATLQAVLDGQWKGLRRASTAIADEAVASGAAGEGLDGAREARRQLQSALRQAGDDAAAVQAQGQALVDEVAGLQAPLLAAA
jgi:chromosome segregation ATPase